MTTLAAEIGFNRSTLQTRFTSQNPLSPRRPGDQQIIDAILRTIGATPVDLEARVVMLERKEGNRDLPREVQDMVRAQMRSFGLTQRTLAEKMGVSLPRVANRLSSPAGLDPDKAVDRAFIHQIADAVGESGEVWISRVTGQLPAGEPEDRRSVSTLLHTMGRDLLTGLRDGVSDREETVRAVAILETLFAHDASSRSQLMRKALDLLKGDISESDHEAVASLMLSVLSMSDSIAGKFLEGELTPANDGM